MCVECVGELYIDELQYVLQKYCKHTQMWKSAECDDFTYKSGKADGEVLRKKDNDIYNNNNNQHYIDCTAFLFSHLRLTSPRRSLPKQELYRTWRRCTSDYLQNVLNCINLK